MQALRQVDILKKQLDELLPMKEEYKRELDKKIRLEFNYNSNHMEGNTLTYQETELLLIFDQSKGNHEMRELEEMKAHDVAYAMVEEWASDKEHTLKESDIRTLNEIILVRAFWKDALTIDGQPTRRKIKVGQYKEQPNSVQLSNGEMFHYASPAETPIKMGELIQWYRDEEEKQELHPVALAAMLHYRFVCIHPFDDGNGRISRLLMNYVLLKASLPPIVIKSSEKKNYLQALHMADTGDLNFFTDYIAGQQLWSMELYIKAAKGESVDEPGDLDRKLEALKKKLRYTEEVQKEKSDKVVYECIEKSLIPFFMSLGLQLDRFDSFFRAKDQYYKISFYIDKPYQTTRTFSEFVSNVTTIKNYNSFTFRRSWMEFRTNTNKAVVIDVQVNFHPLVYEIICEDANVKIDKLYHEELSGDEVAKTKEAIGNALYKKIEAILEN